MAAAIWSASPPPASNISDGSNGLTLYRQPWLPEDTTCGFRVNDFGNLSDGLA